MLGLVCFRGWGKSGGGRREVSSLLPEDFTEFVGRVYYTKNSDEEEKESKECFDWWCRDMCKIELELKDTKRVITGNCHSLNDCGITEVRSLKVIRGVWKLYKARDYSGEYDLLKEGDSRNLEALSTAESTAPAPVPDLSLDCVLFMIHLYEKKDYNGPMHEITVDCPSLNDCGITEVRSLKVIRGVWKLYKARDYNGEYDLLKEGDSRNLEALSTAPTPVPDLSLKCVPFMIHLYENENYNGPMHEITVDCPSLNDCGITEVRSLKVIRGVWKLYKARDYSGKYDLLKEGDSRNLEALSTAESTAPAPVPDRSLKCVPFMIHLYEKKDYNGPIHATTDDCTLLDGCNIKHISSCEVISGEWDLSKGRNYTEPTYRLQKREYPNPEEWSKGNTDPALSVKRFRE